MVDMNDPVTVVEFNNAVFELMQDEANLDDSVHLEDRWQRLIATNPTAAQYIQKLGIVEDPMGAALRAFQMGLELGYRLGVR